MTVRQEMGKGASPFTQGVRQTWRKWKWGKPGAKVYKMFSQFDIGSHQIRLKATGFLHSASSHLDNVNDELFAKPKRSSLPKPDLEELPCCGFLYFWVSVCKRQQKWVSFGCYPAILLLATTIQIRTILLTDITKNDTRPTRQSLVYSIEDPMNRSDFWRNWNFCEKEKQEKYSDWKESDRVLSVSARPGLERPELLRKKKSFNF